MKVHLKSIIKIDGQLQVLKNLFMIIKMRKWQLNMHPNFKDEV
jgi:hypothetical protein